MHSVGGAFKCAFIILAAIVALAFGGFSHDTAAAEATAPAVSMTVQAGYAFVGGGNYRLFGPTLNRAADVWVPVRITLRNTGPNEIDGQLVIADQSTPNIGSIPPSQAEYTLGEKLPPGAYKAAEMYVRGTDLGSQLNVMLESGRQIVASSPINASLQPGGVLSVGILSDDTATRPLMRSLTLQGTALSVTQFDETAPLDVQPQALAGFDLIVANNYAVDTLTAAQLASLRAWVEGGGVLVEAGGPDAQKTLGSLPVDLQAVTWQPSANSVETMQSLPELGRLLGATPPATGPAEVSVATARPGARIVLAHAGVPLAVDLPVGRGHIVYTALEPTLAPFSQWPLTVQQDYWTQVLGGALSGPIDTLIQSYTQNPGPQGSVPGVGAILNDLSALPTRSLPSLQLFAFIVVLYVLVLGPVNFIVLRSMRRLELSWITIPVVALVFGVTSFGLAYTRNGHTVITNVDSIIYLDGSSATKLADSYVGIFAPNQADRYTITEPGPALAWSTSSDGGPSILSTAPPLSIDEGPPFNATLHGLQMWSMRSLALRQQIGLRGRVFGRLNLKGNEVSGSLTNDTSVWLYDCVVIGANGASATIHALPPHSTVGVPPFSLGNAGTTPNGSGGSLPNLYADSIGSAPGPGNRGRGTLVPASRYVNLLGAVFPNGPLATDSTPFTLVGWSTEPVVPLEVNGVAPQRSDLNLLLAPLNLAPAAGRIRLAPGDLPVGVLDTTVAPSPGSPGALTVSPGGDHLDLQLLVPLAGRRLVAQSLSIRVDTSTGNTFTPGSAAVWNWSKRRWDGIDLSSGAWNSARAVAYASPDGRVLLRFAPTQGSLSFGNISQSVGIGLTARVVT